MKQKGYAPVVILLVLALLAAGLIISWYFYSHDQIKGMVESRSPQVSNVPTEEVSSPRVAPKNTAVIIDKGFSWNGNKKEAIVKLDNEEVYTFSFQEIPREVWVGPNNIISLTSTTGNATKSAFSLWLYHKGKLSKIYQEKIVEHFSDKLKIPTEIHQLSYSPAGTFLAIQLNTYEIWSSKIFNTTTGQEVIKTTADPTAFERVFWNKNETCFFNLMGAGMMVANTFQIWKVDENMMTSTDLLLPSGFSNSINSFDTRRSEVYWGKG